MERNLWGIEERWQVMHSLINERVIRRQGLFESLPFLAQDPHYKFLLQAERYSFKIQLKKGSLP